MVYGQRVRDSLWLSDDDIKELDLKKGDGTTIRKAARQLQKVCGGRPLVPEVQQHEPLQRGLRCSLGPQLPLSQLKTLFFFYLVLLLILSSTEHA